MQVRRSLPKSWAIGWFAVGVFISVAIQAMWELVREERIAYEVDKLKEEKLFCPNYICKDNQRRIAYLFFELGIEYEPNSIIPLPDLGAENEEYRRHLHGGDHVHLGPTVIPIRKPDNE